MKNNVLSMSEMPALKELAQKYGFAVHIHDVCGGQSFELEPATENPSKEIYAELEQFFAKYHLSIHFYDAKKRNFTAIKK